MNWKMAGICVGAKSVMPVAALLTTTMKSLNCHRKNGLKNALLQCQIHHHRKIQCRVFQRWRIQHNKILINKILKDKVLIYQGRQTNPQILTRWEAQVREEFREKLEIDTLAQRYDPDKLEELLDNIVEMYCCPRQTQYVGKQPQTTKAIRLRRDKLTSQHVEYIFDVMSNTTQPIKNIMAYLRTTILNAPTTMEHYYQAQGNWLTAQSRKK